MNNLTENAELLMNHRLSEEITVWRMYNYSEGFTRMQLLNSHSH